MPKENKIFMSDNLLTGRTQVDESKKFNSDDFDDTNDIISLKNKTSYWSCSGVAFIPVTPSTDNVTINQNAAGKASAEADGIYFAADVILPQGAEVTGIIVYGNTAAEAETFSLSRVSLTGGTGETMAAENIGTEDTTISNATIDNENYAYHIGTSSLDTNDEIWGARITYTTDYD